MQDGYEMTLYPLGRIYLREMAGKIELLEAGSTRVLHSAHASEWTPNTVEDIRALGIYDQPPVTVDTTGLATEAGQLVTQQLLTPVSEKARYADENGLSQSILIEDFQANTTGQVYGVLGIRLRAGAPGRVKLQFVNAWPESADNFSLLMVENPDSVSNPPSFSDAWTKVQLAQGAGGTPAGATLVTGGEVRKAYSTERDQQIAQRVDLFLEPGSEYWLCAKPHQANLDLFLALNAGEFE